MKRPLLVAALLLLGACTPAPAVTSPRLTLTVTAHDPELARPARVARAGRDSRPVLRPPARTGHKRTYGQHGGRLSDRALTRLRACEGAYTSHGNPPFYGAYQYYWTPRAGSWRSLWMSWGDPVMANTRPDRAAPAVQDYTIRRHWAEGANPYTQWPGCSRRSRWWLA